MKERLNTVLCIIVGGTASLFSAESTPAAAPTNGTPVDRRFEMNPQLLNLPDNTWKAMTPTKEPVYKAYGGFDHPKSESFMVYDESANLTVWFGGCGNGYINSTWLYDCSNNHWKEGNPGTWIVIQGGRDLPDEHLPPGCCQTAMCYSPDVKECLMFKYGGGTGWQAWNQRLDRKHPRENCWWYSARENRWTLKINDNGPRPRLNIAHQFHYDRTGKRALAFAGLDSGSNPCNDLWSYDPSKNAWTELEPSGALPPKRMMTSGCYDEKNGVMIIFGGQPDSDDTWLYNPASNTWREVKAKIAPSRRHASACAYDAANGVMVLFGGRVRKPDNTFTILRDTWTFDAAKEEWTEMKPAQAPNNNPCNYQMAYDRVNNASILVTFGHGTAQTWVYRYRIPQTNRKNEGLGQ